MKQITAVFVCLLFSASAFADETIVLIRHGEKPKHGLGQLNCQGLNRSLALPEVLITKFGKADAIFAPNPAVLKKDNDTNYAYIRPLATIEPTAIRLGLPVDIEFGSKDIAALQATLLSPTYKNAVVYLAWEHHLAEKTARKLVASIDKNEAAKVPVWQDDDFDSIYVIRLTGEAGAKRVTFTLDKQGLNALPESCPTH